MIERCPLCKQKVPSKSRVKTCNKCKKPIKLHDKWRFVDDGDNQYVEHRNCERPTSYFEGNSI